MKTWTQWLGVKEPNDTLSLPINKHQYQQIQIDAMKEGVRTAAMLAPTDEQLADNHGNVSEQRIGVMDFKDRILTKAEQLTEKDL